MDAQELDANLNELTIVFFFVLKLELLCVFLFLVRAALF